MRSNIPEGHPKAPISKDVVRARGIIYAVFLRKISETETALEAYFLLNPKGSIPTSLVNSMIEE